jgi:hypothetical protein
MRQLARLGLTPLRRRRAGRLRRGTDAFGIRLFDLADASDGALDSRLARAYAPAGGTDRMYSRTCQRIAVARGDRGFNSLGQAAPSPHWAAFADFFSRAEIFERPASSPRLGRKAKPQHLLLDWTGSDRARFFALRFWRIYFLDVVRGEGGLNPWRVLARTGGLAAQISPRDSEKLFVGVVRSRYPELRSTGPSFSQKRREIRGGGDRSKAYRNVT